jgi:hypothetical protein
MIKEILWKIYASIFENLKCKIFLKGPRIAEKILKEKGRVEEERH